MSKPFLLALYGLLTGGISSAQLAGSDRLIKSYVARLSERDHFNSQGQRLQSPAAIIRQDRANFYTPCTSSIAPSSCRKRR
ncbi:MAG TPA: hypothetical protein VGD78_12795 [Chthoniobacterales bacterium]